MVRFCRSVGYDGLADFKLKLAGSVNEEVPFAHRSVDGDEKAGDCTVIISNSGRSKDLMDVAEIARMKCAHIVVICASGSALAQEARHAPV